MATQQLKRWTKKRWTKKRRIWVVEILNIYFHAGIRWEPTVGCALTKWECIELAGKWRAANPDDKFRVRAYEALP